MLRSVSLLLLLSALAACSEESPSDPAPDAGSVDEPDGGGLQLICPGIRAKGPKPLFIRNGVNAPDPTVAAMTSGQQLAVGALLYEGRRRWVNFCTGTLVAPNVVLTAAHCVNDGRSTSAPEEVRFGIGPDMASPLRTFEVTSVHVHPSYPRNSQDERYDFAVLKLAEDATAAVSGLTYIGVNRSAVPGSLVGRRGQVGGYGQTHPDDDTNTRRFWTTERIASVTEIGILVDGDGESAVCYGDSGGPVFFTAPDGNVRTYGVLSWGDPSCLDVDHFGRIDSQLMWIESVAGELSDPSKPEPEVPDAGTPDAGTPDAGTGTPDAGSGTPDAGSGTPDAGTGTPDAGTETPDAGEPDAGNPTDPCGGIDWEGRCVGNISVWCESGALQAFDCDRCGQACGEAGTLGYHCVPRL